MDGFVATHFFGWWLKVCTRKFIIYCVLFINSLSLYLCTISQDAVWESDLCMPSNAVLGGVYVCVAYNLPIDGDVVCCYLQLFSNCLSCLCTAGMIPAVVSVLNADIA